MITLKNNKVLKSFFISATFKGREPSAGYMPQCSYVLEVTLFKNSPAMAIMTKNDKSTYCHYSDYETFLNNWRGIYKVNTQLNF